MTIGKQIQALRRAHGWTQHDLAVKLGCRSMTISTWETETHTPDWSTLARLAEVLECKLIVKLEPKQ
mgnify:CR=1 FL=1